VLDEPTSALDTESELIVQQALRPEQRAEAAGRSTLIVAAHRLATVSAADEILVLGPSGVVVERGTHAALVRCREGWYARMCSEQSVSAARDAGS